MVPANPVSIFPFGREICGYGSRLRILLKMLQGFDDRRCPSLGGVRVSFFQVCIGSLEIEIR
jgi:hypothetical protein